ncbi:MAG: mucoidy inhibitor MuiA family protein [Opitutus sp.]|nr:mucoidy inhibitor MuiA family protein [Opitutus sp.]MCS6248279.1 mucoidy inhibitor MuiA family protein [Opitutus sp.]MCS6274792.1 mucoidy inhibitor MuiA family protein [Opitutus sp.]MCS6277388.1 mucoidy inhibitor MuiA family protein [Opitutus sp.]MCS6300510.1 mucoidy inhibitor MuiA family protein [Opitutus sp.]
MHLLRLPLVLVALVCTSALAAPIPAESTLTAATIYPDRAVVTRTASLIDVPAGTTEISFGQLPAALLDESVQVSAKGTTAAALLDITTRIAYVTAEPDARVKTLEDQLLALRRDERALNDQGSVLESQRALLTSIEKVSTTPVTSRPGETPPARPALDDYEKLLGFSASQRARFDAAAQKLDLDRTALAEKIAATQAQLNELRGKQPSRRAQKTVTVRLATEAAGKLDLTLSYGLPGASWAPAYDARLRSEKRQVQLDAFGLVRNGTGEDWKAITLTLSTARPGLGGAAPEIAPWLVDVARVVNYSRAEGSSMAFDHGLGSAKRKSLESSLAPTAALADNFAAAPEPIAAVNASAQIETAATSASFKIATPVTLASDNTPQRLPLGAVTLAAELSYQATPKLQETAYLAAAVVNRSELPLLAGALNVFLDDTFVATARLATTMPGEKFTLNLGADEGIAIKRKIVSRFTEDTGFTTKSRRTTYDILVTLTNNKRTTERVVIQDVAPVSRDEKIVVELIAPAARELLKPEDAAAQPPKAGIARDATGKITWRLDLKPGEKREIPLKFSIEHPADLPVTGVE